MKVVLNDETARKALILLENETDPQLVSLRDQVASTLKSSRSAAQLTAAELAALVWIIDKDRSNWVGQDKQALLLSALPKLMALWERQQAREAADGQ